MKIAICDDDRKDRMDLREALEVVWPDAEADEYSAGRDLLSQIEGGGSLRSDFFRHIYGRDRRIGDRWRDTETLSGDGACVCQR